MSRPSRITESPTIERKLLMKSTLTAVFVLATLSFTHWTEQTLAQGSVDVRFSSAVEDFAGAEEPAWGDDEELGPHAGNCECCCGPTWTVTADAIFMHRSRPDSLVLMQDLFNATRNLNADAFDFGFASGWDVAVQRATSHGSLEARFFSINGWDSATTAIAGPPSIVLINNALPFTTPGVTSINAGYGSKLASAELNLRRSLADRVSLLAGFRYLELDEHFHADLNDAALLPTTWDTQTRNRLYGGQLGVDTTLICRGRLTVDSLAKFGLFYNAGGQQSVYDSGGAAVMATDTRDRAAFLGELAFTANYCLSDRLTLRAGYDLLWLETVALATDQVPATNFATASGINADGGAFYHGAFAGLEYRR